MCGRYAYNITRKRFEQAYAVQAPLEFVARYNLAPTQRAPVLRSHNSELEATMLAWGITSHNKPIINARAETALEKPLFRQAMRSRRCLIPASGWYEWRVIDGIKQPYYLSVENEDAIAFAGIWTDNQYSILTTTANEAINHIHDRMPVIVARDRWRVWLADTPMGEIEAMLEPFDARVTDAYPVSKKVGNVRNDDATLLDPLS